jgi:hypothetical protein
MVLNGNDAMVTDVASQIRSAAIAKKVGENKSSNKGKKGKKGKAAKTNKVADTPKIDTTSTTATSDENKAEDTSLVAAPPTTTTTTTTTPGDNTALDEELDADRKAEALKEKDKLNESIISRGSLYAQDNKGRTIFHIAAELPKLNPTAAPEVMSKLMERITAQPCGIAVWNNSIDDTEDLNVTEPEDGYEEWPSTIENENSQTAWHIIVSHTMSTKVSKKKKSKSNKLLLFKYLLYYYYYYYCYYYLLF